MENGLFGLKIMPASGPSQEITGLWRLHHDGIQLTLFNLQDRELPLTAGASGIHGIFPGIGAALLTPSAQESATFTLAGLLEKTGDHCTITDAASGQAFMAEWPEKAKDNSFATAEITISHGKADAVKILSHSGKVPKLLEKPPSRTGMDVFAQSVTGRYWLLPKMPGIEKAALRFGTFHKLPGGEARGDFDISGPGLRLEGTYLLNSGKLTLTTPNANLKDLKLIGADALARALLGELAWQLSSRGLELSGSSRLLLLPNQF